MNRVIINGDDFGMNERCSNAIAQSMRDGLITDTTMMANGTAFDAAITLAREQDFTDRIGIHFNITEGEPLTDEIKAMADFVTDGRFNRRYDLNRELTVDEYRAVYAELCGQAEKLLKQDIAITHADSHHYVHTMPHIAPIVMSVCHEYGIKRIRLRRNLGNIPATEMTGITACNNLLRKQGFLTTAYFAKLREMGDQPIPDRTELLVHPDYDRDGQLIDRIGMRDGYPVGKPIIDLRLRESILPVPYTKLLP